jgi:hypothetical protein
MMTRQLLLFLLLFSLQYFALGQGKKGIPVFNPTGTYNLDNKTYVKHGETYGSFGTIKVKLINADTIKVSLYICIGAPSYHDGYLVDTLVYRDHWAVYHHAEDDTSCRITFYFTAKGVMVAQAQANLNFGCDFGHAVFADGYYKKVSGSVPVIKDEE